KAIERKAAKAATKPATKPAATSPLAGGKRININTATKAELIEALPGIGPVKSQAIIDTRPFKTIEDIMKTKGIKEGEFSKIKDMITVE
ncbi:ComEA family DNA-binding protein, partial [Singulisphaera rosea]